MNKEAIMITSIVPQYDLIEITGLEPIINQTGLKVTFDYKQIKNAEIEIKTDVIDVTAIKERIVEVISK